MSNGKLLEKYNENGNKGYRLVLKNYFLICKVLLCLFEWMKYLLLLLPFLPPFGIDGNTNFSIFFFSKYPLCFSLQDDIFTQYMPEMFKKL